MEHASKVADTWNLSLLIQGRLWTERDGQTRNNFYSDKHIIFYFWLVEILNVFSYCPKHTPQEIIPYASCTNSSGQNDARLNANRTDLKWSMQLKNKTKKPNIICTSNQFFRDSMSNTGIEELEHNCYFGGCVKFGQIWQNCALYRIYKVQHDVWVTGTFLHYLKDICFELIYQTGVTIDMLAAPHWRRASLRVPCLSEWTTDAASQQLGDSRGRLQHFLHDIEKEKNRLRKLYEWIIFFSQQLLVPKWAKLPGSS